MKHQLILYIGIQICTNIAFKVCQAKSSARSIIESRREPFSDNNMSIVKNWLNRINITLSPTYLMKGFRIFA